MTRTAPDVATGTGALLPHLFTLTHQLADGYFLLRGFRITPDFPLGSMAPCVARTFLTDLSARRRYQRDRTDCRDKDK